MEPTNESLTTLIVAVLIGICGLGVLLSLLVVYVVMKFAEIRKWREHEQMTQELRKRRKDPAEQYKRMKGGTHHATYR